VILKKEGRVLASLVKSTQDETIVALPEVKSETLRRVIQYCEFASSAAAENLGQRLEWENQFVKVDMDQGSLCELASAAYYLDIKNLVNLTSKVIATQISGGAGGGDLREALVGASKQPITQGILVETTGFGTRARLTRKMESQRMAVPHDPQGSTTTALTKVAAATAATDDRTLDELLSFIEDESRTKRKKKKKKKHKVKPAMEAEHLQFSPASATSDGGGPADVSVGAGGRSGSVAGTAVTSTTTESCGEAFGGDGCDEGGCSEMVKGNDSSDNSDSHMGISVDMFALIGKRREAARAKLAATSAADVVWAGSEDEVHTELDIEVQAFRERLVLPPLSGDNTDP
jgi:hypothetical protein